RKELSAGGSSNYMEHVRGIRTALFDISRSKKPKIILVTSSAPNEGKTSLCCALGRILNNSGKNVLLIDADLRRPDLRSVLQLKQEAQCLSKYLNGEAVEKNLVIHSDIINADVISPVQPSHDAAELLLSPRLGTLLSFMSKKYDHIIINAPPVMHLADALVLAHRADATLFTVRCNKTRTKTVRNAIRRLKDGDANIVGTVLTMVRRSDLAAREADLYSNTY
ncbi:CpsD/CapB family tyrosine-protein kinase, partial [Falsihalocynthiibacter sp. BN13B15]